jgi:hypothetical protein
MGAIVEDFGDHYVSSATDYTNGYEISVADVGYLVDVIATNLSGDDGVIYVYVKHVGDTDYTKYSWIAFNLPLPSQNSYTTSKFAINQGDSLYVAGSAGISFHAQGMDQIVS